MLNRPENPGSKRDICYVKIETMPSSTFYIPSVDISPYLRDPASDEARQVIEDIRAACLSTGFFQVTGHGVSRQIQDDLFKASQRFFSLSPDDKADLSLKKHGNKGYDAMATQSYESDVLADMKEGYLIGADLAPDHPHVLANRFFAKPNVWPRKELLANDAFKEPVQRYYEAMRRLSSVVLDLVAATLPYGPDVFEGVRAEPFCPLRLLHYPPMPAESQGKRQLSASAHTDFGVVTLLLQDEHEGLEVLDQDTERWELVPPNPDGYVVNLGDMMHKLTRGVYKSSVHRVLNRNPTDRYSVGFFFNGTPDYVLTPFEPLKEGEKAEKEVTVEQYLMERLRASYGKHEGKKAA